MRERFGSWHGFARHLLRRGRHIVAVMLAAAAAIGCGGGGDQPGAPSTEAMTDGPTKSALAARDLPAATPGVRVYALLPVAVRQVSRTVFDFDYRLVLRNTGPAVSDVVVRLAGQPTRVQVIDGLVSADTLPANSTTIPADRITIRKGLLPLFILRPQEWLISVGPPTIAGTAAVGAALANANVTVTDVAGANACTQARVVTSGTGEFSCSVRTGSVAPFLIVVTDPLGLHPPLISVAAAAPAPGATLVANATPLTTAIVGQLAADGKASTVVSNPALINVAALANITAKVVAQIQPVAALLGLGSYDPFSTRLEAATPQRLGNTADQLIELLRITQVNGESRIATVDNPDASVPLANPAAGTPQVLPPPAPTLVSLQATLSDTVGRLNNCFALPAAQRALAVDTTIPRSDGGPSVTQLHPSCQNIGHPDYLGSGYRFGQRFYSLLTNPALDGAQFKPAEIMYYLEDATPADQDLAVVNLRYVSAVDPELVGNVIDVVRKLPGSATAAHPSEWWLHGNRRPVDANISSLVLRNEQLAPNGGFSGPFANAPSSRFETGFNLFVNKDGPGSAGMRAARITGPGLPTAGVVLTRPNPAIITDQNWLNIRRKDGLTDPASATPADATGNFFRLSRTQGLAGVDATTLRPNPNAAGPTGTDNVSFPQWAHPLDYGAAAGTPTVGYIDFSRLAAWSNYTYEIFYDGEVSPRHVFAGRIVNPVVPASNAAALEWLDFVPDTKRYLTPSDPLAGAQSTISLAVTRNEFAERVRSFGAYTFGLDGLGVGRSISDAVVSVALGGASGTASAPPGFQFPALTGVDAGSGRTFQIRYRTLDGSSKDSFTRFN